MHERLARVQDEVRRVRASERVLVEQVDHLAGVAADAETRSLVAETPLAERESRTARRDLDRHRAALDDTRRELERLLAQRDQLLEDLLEPAGPEPGRDHP